jgi:hypothetical protein
LSFGFSLGFDVHIGCIFSNRDYAMKGSKYLSVAAVGLWLTGGIWVSALQTGVVVGRGKGSAIGKKLPMETQPVAAVSSAGISISSGGELLLTDSSGRRTGFNPAGGGGLEEIPHANYTNDSIDDPSDDSDDPASIDEKRLDMMPPQPGTYTLSVYGTRNGAYDLEFRTDSGDSVPPPSSTVLEAVPAWVGSRQSYSLTIPPGGGPIDVSGAFMGAQQGKASARLLTYASTLASDSSLPAGAKSFPVVIFYGAQAISSTFSATLDGTAITASFHPASGRFDIVQVPLHPGRNVLELSIAGSGAAVGTPVKDRLVFTVAP